MEVRYIEIKTSPAGQIIRAYTPEQYKKEMARRKNATARARKLTRLQERVGAVLAMLGFLMLLGAGGMCEIGQRAGIRNVRINALLKAQLLGTAKVIALP